MFYPLLILTVIAFLDAKPDLSRDRTILMAHLEDSGGIRLTWKAVASADNYRIKRTDEGTGQEVFVQVAQEQNFYVDEQVQPEHSYYYNLCMIVGGRASAYSNAARVDLRSSSSIPAKASKAFRGTFQSVDSRVWSAQGGAWILDGRGAVLQKDGHPGDLKRFLFLPPLGGGDIQVTVKLRVDSWEFAKDARAGIALAFESQDNRGINFVFHDDELLGPHVAFLYDGLTWGNRLAFRWEKGKWYWLKLRTGRSRLLGKVWCDDEDEPSEWLLDQNGWNFGDLKHIHPALNGGSAGTEIKGFQVAFGCAFIETFGETSSSPPARKPDDADLFEPTMGANAPPPPVVPTPAPAPIRPSAPHVPERPVPTAADQICPRCGQPIGGSYLCNPP
jgi:hypothetical protein